MNTELRTRVDTRPRRTAVIFVLSLAIAVLSAGLVYRALNTIRTSREGRSATGSLETKLLPRTPAHLVALIDRQGAPVSFLVLAPAQSGGGTLMVLPASTRVDGKIAGPSGRLADVFGRGGLPEQTTAVGRYLGIDFASSFVQDSSGLASLFSPFAPFDVTLDAPVVDTDQTHSDRIIHDAGRASLSASVAAELLLARADAEPESMRLPRAEAIWNAVGSRVASQPVVTGGAGSAAGVLLPLLKGPTSVYRFPAVAVTDPTRNPSAVPLVEVDIADIRLKMAQILPGAVSVAASGIRVEIQDPFANQALVRDTVVLLTFLGAYVVYVHTTTTPPMAQTTVQYSRISTRQAADFLVNALHTPEAQLSSAPVENVDATVVLGTDLRDETLARIATSSTTAATVAVSPKP